MNGAGDAEGPQVSGQVPPGSERSLTDDIERVKEARAYVREHFKMDPQTYVGHMPVKEFDRAVDHIVAFADKAYELLNDVVNTPSVGPGLSEDIAYVLGLIERWTCGDCGCVNGAHEAFCYRCGACPEPPASGDKRTGEA